jgi:hypothetical protein
MCHAPGWELCSLCSAASTIAVLRLWLIVEPALTYLLSPLVAAVRHEAFQYENRQMTFVDLPTTGVHGAAAPRLLSYPIQPGQQQQQQQQQQLKQLRVPVPPFLCLPSLPPAEHYPYLLVNIGSGVSIVRVDGENKFQRVSGEQPALPVRQAGGRAGGQQPLPVLVCQPWCLAVTVPPPLCPACVQALTSGAAPSGACASC